MGSFKIRQRDDSVHTVLVDDADLQSVVDAGPWFIKRCSRTNYARRNALVDGRRVYQMLHDFLVNPKPGLVVDHRNHDGLDNRRENLRVCTPKENLLNRRRYRNSTSGAKGVCWDAQRTSWRADIARDGVRRFLGFYDSPAEAYAAYRGASIILHGEFSCLE